MLTPECELKVAVEHLLNWRQGGTSFSCVLFAMFQKSDMSNFARLSMGFPVHAEAYRMWYEADREHLFFKEHGFEQHFSD